MERLSVCLPNPAFLLLVLLLTVTSCAPVRRSAEPPVALPAGFSVSGGVALAENWWKAFEDPALDQLVDKALADNFSLRAAWARLAQAEAVARRAGAGLWPALELQGDATHLRSDDGSVVSRSDGLTLGLAASYELDLWGRVRGVRDAAALDLMASRQDLQIAALSLASRVCSAWFDLVEQRGQLALLDEQLRTNEQVLELVTMRFRRGQVGASDVLQQRQLIEANRAQKVQAEGKINLLKSQLAILQGLLPGEFTPAPSDVLAGLPPLPVTGLPAELIRRRPDLQSAYYRLLAADRRTAAAIAERFPRLTISARIGTEEGGAAVLFENWLASLSAGLVGPLIDGGMRRAEVERNRGLAAEALQLYGQATLIAIAEVEDALEREVRQQQYLDRLEKQLELATLVTERVRDRYIRGSVEYLRVLNALLSQQELERAMLNARRQLIEERIGLYRALAGGLALTPPAEAAGPNPPLHHKKES